MFKVKSNLSIDEFKKEAEQITWWLKIPFSNGVTTKGQTSVKEILKYLQIPEDLSGKRVLDIGCSDGFFSFLAEQRGAEVIAIDAFPSRGFKFAHKVLDSKVEFRQMGVYDLDLETVGAFDIVFFFGVYYHIKHPTIALEKIAKITKELVIIESAVLAEDNLEDHSVIKFFEDNRPGNDMTQYWLSTSKNLYESTRLGGFPKIKIVSKFFHPQRGNRAVIHGFKTPKTSDKFLSDDIIVRVDNPKPEESVGEDFIVNGWALDYKCLESSNIQDIEVYIDDISEENRLSGEVRLGLKRDDVSKYLNVHHNTGFQFLIKKLKVEKRNHRLYVCVYSKTAWNYHPIIISF